MCKTLAKGLRAGLANGLAKIDNLTTGYKANMDAIVKNIKLNADQRPTREEAEEAVRTLIAWAGDDPARAGVIDTPKRVVNAYNEFFRGYGESPEDVLGRSFEEEAGYDDIVLLKDIDISSHCEHHMVPFLGRAHVAYFPTDRVVGISKLARVVDIYAHRLQTQETMTAQICGTIEKVLKPKGTAILIDAVHQCMSTRGIKKPNIATSDHHVHRMLQGRHEFAKPFYDDGICQLQMSEWTNRSPFLQERLW